MKKSHNQRITLIKWVVVLWLAANLHFDHVLIVLSNEKPIFAGKKIIAFPSKVYQNRQILVIFYVMNIEETILYGFWTHWYLEYEAQRKSIEFFCYFSGMKKKCTTKLLTISLVVSYKTKQSISQTISRHLREYNFLAHYTI